VWYISSDIDGSQDHLIYESDDEDPFENFTEAEVEEVQNIANNQATFAPALMLMDADDDSEDDSEDEFDDYYSPESPGH
jgi:hypothetical protein